MPQANAPKELPFQDVIELIQRGDMAAARARLKLPPGAVSDEEFVNAMIALQNAAALCAQGGQAQALPYFAAITPVIEKSGDEAAKTFVNLLEKSSLGIVRILNNDPNGAMPLLSEAREIAERIAFFAPELKKMALEFQAMGGVAAMRASLNVGDYEAAERFFGEARERYRQFLELLDPNNPDDRAGYVETYATRLEGSTSFAIVDLQALDVEAAEKRLFALADDAAALEQAIAAMAPGPLAQPGRLVLANYRIIQRFVALEKAVIFERSPAGPGRLEEFKTLERELFAVLQLALDAGERGKIYAAFARILDRQRRNLLALDERKIRSVDKERIGQIVSFLALIALVVVVQLTIHPSGLIAAALFAGEVAVALITGFGYSAVRFQGMLGQYGELIARAAGVKAGGATAAGAPNG